jgi:hypothetical protein
MLSRIGISNEPTASAHINVLPSYYGCAALAETGHYDAIDLITRVGQCEILDSEQIIAVQITPGWI